MKKYLLLFPLCLLFFNAVSQHGPKMRRIEGQGNGGLVLDFVPGMHDSILNSPTSVYNYPLYDNNAGPVSVDIYNSAVTPAGEFMIVFRDTTANLAGNDFTDYSSKWILVHVPTHDTVFGDSIIGVDHVQDIPAWGMKIRTNPTDNPGQSIYTNNGFLEATMEFANPSLPWLTGLSDHDSTGSVNWIRSGTHTVPWQPEDNDYVSLDDNEAYEGVLNGTWSPYRLCGSTSTPGAGPVINMGEPAWDRYMALNLLKNVASIDVVITADASKWTRCPVLELQQDPSLAIGGAKKMSMRKSPSVDKSGRHTGDSGYNAAEGGAIDSAGIGLSSPTGMGWFPGYAVNLETGERLNMAFGEDSYFPSENGADMKWNPTATVNSGSTVIYGGKHYIYIFGHNGDAVYSSFDPILSGQRRDIPVYDKGLTLYKLLQASENATTGTAGDGYKREVYSDAMWVNIPLLNPGYSLMATDVNVRLRVSKQYRQQYVNGTNNSDPEYIFDAGTLLGVHSMSAAAPVKIYPNPAHAQLNIQYAGTSEEALVEIFDIRGLRVKQERMSLQSVMTIPVNDLEKGMYIVKVRDEKSVFTSKFLKE
jgi:hypothetical protein